jgi:hypothetical protein
MHRASYLNVRILLQDYRVPTLVSDIPSGPI